MGWLILVAVILVFLAVILIRTAAFKPKAQAAAAPAPVQVDEEKAVGDLQRMIQCKTVSFREQEKEDRAEFDKFRALLRELYPRVHEAMSLERIGRSGLLYHWKGRGKGAPSVFMAHYDVVPANEAAWDKPPFAGVIEDGVLWGRGTLDTKGTLCGVMEGAETLLGQGYVPENDIYLAFAGDEEIAGPTAPAMVDELEKRGIHPALVVDEGGAVVENVFPGVNQPCALIGIGEKGMMNLRLSLEGQGGHASAPPAHTPVGVLAKAVVDIENHPFRFQLTKPAREMFDTLGRHSTFVYRMIFANLWYFKPVLNAICKKSGGELNALMRTTCAFTQMQGSPADNVIPPSTSVGANMRLCGADTLDSAMDYLKGVVDNPAITFTRVHGMNPSPYSRTQGEGWEKLKNAINQTWPEALISPYLMVACSDSRHYCRISENVYRFSAMALTKEERGMIHGNNERIPLEKIVRTAQFYVRLMGSC